ncbi:MAG: hypothetical protein CSA72_02070 [Rhodobacterales bacterium]|nr:MAG: hypothetical protein CSA72_02070 [Rhodobacterales bacterium]
MTGIVFAPLVPLWALAALAALVALATVWALWKGLRGWPLRGLAGLVLLAALSGPALREEERETLNDIFVVAVDRSASQELGTRPDQTERALAHLRRELAARGQVETVEITDAAQGGGTRLMSALSEALTDLPRSRIAGVFALSDGVIHDTDLAPDLPAPLHLLRTGRAQDWDRRLVMESAPAYAILGEDITLRFRVEDTGAAPGADQADLVIAVDGGPEQVFTVPVGRSVDLPYRLPHGGMNLLRIETPAVEGELTDRNNGAIVRINGVRDRLRVLLVSGEPHAGERTWRNLLKSDPSVDLVHFTILRPPEKQDGVPVTELSLIAFPTRELFLEKIDEFDLIVFDRYKRRGILPTEYFANIQRYVEDGGAILVAAGPDFAGADSLWRSPLGNILPGSPTARVVEQGFRPTLTELGARHPVTRGLGDDAEWGRWFRQIDLRPAPDAQILMEGLEGRPLLLLQRVGEGRVALLASDQAWLWGRGFEGGGPQLELLRRLAHWEMKEPELEEEVLTALPEDGQLRVQRRTLEDSASEVTVTRPDGSTQTLPLALRAPGLFEAVIPAPDPGIYRLRDDTLEAVTATGPAAPREFEQTIATSDLLAPAIAAGQGGNIAIEDGLPRIREVRAGRIAAGAGWLGVTPRGAYLTADLRLTPLLPAWLALLLAAGLMLWGWLREGRR